MNFLEAIALYKHGKKVKRKGDAFGLFPSYSMVRKKRNERDHEKLRETTLSVTEADLLANDWIVYGEVKDVNPPYTMSKLKQFQQHLMEQTNE
jgi:hypothetical protein